ncbi:MAG: B12-binding domain-containing radical SAM protein [Bacteroidales bacterium]|nr:B12-binding domain-containing radical SAM protein [Bacteroidales bacterium]
MTGSKKKYKLLLINPANQRRKGLVLARDRIFPPMAFGIIAALTPDNWEVEILDESFAPFEYKEADLVGFTSLTTTVNRCYQIAGEYRKNRIPTVIGGIHVSMLPEEASRYVDSVVIGEAEGIWPKLIDDFEKNRLQQYYHAKLPSLVDNPSQKTNLYNPGYNFSSMQTTRGCPMKCEFCSVHTFNGSKYRLRPIEQSVRDFINSEKDRVFVVDDNFVGYNKASRNHAKEFLKGILKSGVKKDWFGASSMNIAEDEEILEYMARSGCKMVYLGIESERIDQLEQMKKKTNLKIGVDKYAEVYDKIHKYGISIMGSFIYGLGNDTPQTIYERTSYIIDADIDMMQSTMLTPLPGTVLFKEFEEAGRLLHTNFPEDWERYGYIEVVIKPKLMSPQEFHDAVYESWERMYDLKALKKKFLRTLQTTKDPTAAVWGITTNLQMRNMVFEGTKESLEPEEAFPDLLKGIQLR